MNVDLYTKELQSALGDNLCSVILYGSAAGADYQSSKSDLNLLVLSKKLGLDDLKTVAQASESWVKSGQALPLFMTREAMMDSADVFPVEMLDILESRRVLWGEDVPALLDISRENLRHQLEFELKSKLIRLRSRYLVLHRDSPALYAVMMESKTGFLVLFRALLRLFKESVPVAKLDALPVLTDKWGVDLSVFHELEKGAASAATPAARETERLFRRYLLAIESIVKHVDGV